MRIMKMKTTRSLGFLAACALVVAACVTINVYFPAAAAEKAADRIIEEVWGTDAQPAPAGEPTSRAPDLRRLAAAVLELLVPTAAAQSADLDISSPAITGICSRRSSGHTQSKVRLVNGVCVPQRDGTLRL